MRNLLLLFMLFAATGMMAQSTGSLVGWRFEGTVEAEATPGCEGCGNRGMVHFRSTSEVDFLLPGSDMMDRRKYQRKGEYITLDGGRITMWIQGDSLFLDAYDRRHPYVRVRKVE